MSVVNEVTAANESYASAFVKGSLPAPPRRKFAVVTCMDARLDPARFLGLEEGDAHVIRNAGGRATPEAISALAVSQALLGTREVMVVHHTECAMGRMGPSELAARIEAATGHPFHEKLDCFSNPVEAVREDVDRLRGSTSLAHRDHVRGFVYDLANNSVEEVAAR
jgi:carbonic anhydrase